MKPKNSCAGKTRRTFHKSNRNTNETRKNNHKRWQASDNTFRCRHCHQMIYANPYIGTHHRNHCPYCLWSLHVDTKPGNRASSCHGGMEPIALTFRQSGFDKYGRPRCGDVMLVHMCHGCGSVNLNRIAGDDFVDGIFEIFQNTQGLASHVKRKLETEKVELIQQDDLTMLNTAIFGKSHQGYLREPDP